MPTEDSTAPCFECGAPADHTHHVVPESRGGTRSLPLCSKCHYHAHHGSGNMTTAALTREGIIRARGRGAKIGASNPQCRNLTPEGRAKGRVGSALTRHRLAIEAMASLIPLMTAMREHGASLRDIADRLNADGHTTRKGAKWSPTQVSRVLSFNHV